ncbi:MAG: glycerol-3-phosphate dehydrogenase/oxidase [Verrucomicrobia bacterium]|nr:glycerol-3-phosphate dehydrogenase/oxidase [Verrucomicrobiota bacterium]MCH8512393.1 glycerol-3-phosphate dehydrogenase/oxidase [Kiritimatiellia bacterium]
MKRETAIDQIENQTDPYDILVVGGGATGLGTAVDAASRGHRVLLMEQGDFAMGTSSRSTKLVHGGVRYLKQGNISLVLEALRERGLLYRNAPHLVHNMAFVIPNYKWWEGPFYGVGMKVYDSLAGKLGLSPSKVLSKKEVVEAIPTVETEHLTGGVVYHDGQFDDARLALNLAQTAVGCGACVVNYMKCVGLIKENDAVVGVRARDQETGAEYEIRAKAVVNATGVFVDELRQQDDPDATGIIAVSQGIHVVLPKSFLPGNAAIMIPKTEDGRVLFCVPWHDRVVVGTTDTPLKHHSLEPRALKEERDFIMEHAAKYLSKDPAPEDVLSIFAGLRPLVKSGDASNTAALSRDHTILVSHAGLITVTGGKWTTYRKMAEDVVDQAEMVAGVENRDCVSKHLQIHGWTQTDIPEKNLSLYGSEAAAIRQLGQEQDGLNTPLHPRLPYWKSEVVWHAKEEMARTVEDVLSRRTRALLLDAVASAEAAETTAKLMAEVLNKSEDWIQEQVQSYRKFAKGYVFLEPESILG